MERPTPDAEERDFHLDLLSLAPFLIVLLFCLAELLGIRTS